MIIYKVTNLINNKIYIGQTIGALQKRKLKHLSEAKLYPTLPFARALIKYGKENFNWEKIDKAKTRNSLNEKEKFWIWLNNSTNSNFGYNCTIGGNSVILSPDREAKRIKNLYKKVNQYKLDGTFIKTWNSVKDAENYYNDLGQVISKCARKHKYCKTARGFQWNYEFVKQMEDVSQCTRIGKKNKIKKWRIQ